jgi:hypothetical protein
MIQSGQLRDRGAQTVTIGGRHAPPEQPARDSLRAQIARLEAELSAIFTEGFPHLSIEIYAPRAESGPRLLSLAELERLRDRLAMRAAGARELLEHRRQFERESREMLKRMRLEPGRYKFARVSVRDLGQGTCGVWEVRPRLGLIGMLAGWWQVKLSSGCPLPWGCAGWRSPKPLSSDRGRGV